MNEQIQNFLIPSFTLDRNVHMRIESVVEWLVWSPECDRFGFKNETTWETEMIYMITCSPQDKKVILPVYVLLNEHQIISVLARSAIDLGMKRLVKVKCNQYIHMITCSP